MSSIPGYTLEMFLKWLWNIRVVGTEEANVSVAMAELIGTVASRPMIDEGTFKNIVSMYEQYRESIEDRLADFDEETQSWRSYADHVDSDVPSNVSDAIKLMLNPTSPSCIPNEGLHGMTVPKHKYDSLVKELELKERTIRELSDQIQLNNDFVKGNTWYWDPYDDNRLDTITCPIVIDANVLRNMLRTTS